MLQTDTIVLIAFIVLAAMSYYLLYREQRFKRLMGSNRRELFYFREHKELQEYSEELSKLDAEQRLILIKSLLGQNRPVRASITIYDAGIVLDAIYVDKESQPDSKHSPSYVG